MNIKIELDNMELLGDDFKNNKQEFDAKIEIKNHLTRKFSLGIAENVNDENDRKVLLGYKAMLEQKDRLTDKTFSESFVEYLFFFVDKNGEIIDKLEKSNFEDEEKEELILYLNKLSYPYIKEHLENKYKKANIEMKLPFEFDNDK